MKRTVKYLQEIGLLRAMSVDLTNGDRLSGLLSESRVDKVNDTEGKFFLDIRHADEDWTEPATVEDFVMVNWFGTLILDEHYKISRGKILRNQRLLVGGRVIWKKYS